MNRLFTDTWIWFDYKKYKCIHFDLLYPNSSLSIDYIMAEELDFSRIIDSFAKKITNVCMENHLFLKI